MKLLVHLAAACCLLFISCKKESQLETTPETNPEILSNARVIYQLSTTERSSQLAVNAPSENAGLYTTNRIIPSVTWTAGSASVSEIWFKAKAWRNNNDDDDDDNDDNDNDDNGDDDDGGNNDGNNGNPDLEFHSRVPQTIDLFSALPTLGFLTIPPGNYHKIELKIKFKPLNGHPAFALKGNYVNEAGNIIPIDFSINQPFEIKFQLKSKEKLDANIDYNALNELALNLLTNGISARDLRSAVRDNNGRLFINANKNGALFKAMWDNFKVMLKVKMKKK